MPVVFNVAFKDTVSLIYIAFFNGEARMHFTNIWFACNATEVMK